MIYLVKMWRCTCERKYMKMTTERGLAELVSICSRPLSDAETEFVRGIGSGQRAEAESWLGLPLFNDWGTQLIFVYLLFLFLN